MKVLGMLYKKPTQTLRYLGNEGAIKNASRSKVEKEEAIARANLAITQIHDDFCAVTLQYLKTAFLQGKICAWSVNRLIELMYAGLEPQQARDGITALIEAKHPKVREAILRKLAGLLNSDHRLAEQIKLPTYLLHPAGSD